MKLPKAVSRVGAWIRKHRKAIGFTVIGLTLLSIAVQLVYPYGRALPFASVAGHSVGMKERPAITLAIQDSFTHAMVTLRSGDKEVHDELRNLGAEVDADEMALHAVEYPMLFRFVPFSILWYQPGLDRYQLEFDEARLKKMSDQYANELSKKATDAGLAINKGELEVTAAEDGREVTPESLRDRLVATQYNWDETLVEIDGSTLEPRVSNASVADIRQQAEAILAQSITISVADKGEFTPSREQIASWLSLETTKNGSIGLTSNQKTIDAYVKTIADKTATKPTATTVTLVDDKETARKAGKSGLGISTNDLSKQLVQSVELPQVTPRSIALKRQPIAPPVTYERSYTNSQVGLSTYAKDIAEEGDVYIAVRQLGGSQWSANGNAHASIASASTYKPMLMLKILEDINNKDKRWKDKIGGETLQECFERMIVLSANECAEALIKEYGVFELTDYLHSRGFSNGTGFTFKETTQTTAADLAKLMVGIENGDLLKKKDRDMMLEKMGRQIYRQGIPAGTSAQVYDKVGFLWDYIHDAAIVDHPEGRYVLVVMTKGKSWGKVAEITRDVEAILYGDGLSR